MLDEEAFCSLVNAFGSERILFGSDSPWADQSASLSAIRALPLRSEEKDNILGRNARKLLCL